MNKLYVVLKNQDKHWEIIDKHSSVYSPQKVTTLCDDIVEFPI